MDLNKLRTFVVVAETGNMTKAAGLLYRTQPAITQQLQSLEEEIGLSLMERRNARIFLTRDGEQLFQAAKQGIQGLDEALDAPQRQMPLKGSFLSWEAKRL